MKGKKTITDKDLKYIPQFTKLVKLNLEDCFNVTDQGLKH